MSSPESISHTLVQTIASLIVFPDVFFSGQVYLFTFTETEEQE